MIRVRLPQVPEGFLGRVAPLPARLCPTVEDCLASGTLLLEGAGVGSARLDAECLLAHVLGWPRWRLVADQRRRLSQEEFGRYLSLLQRREWREPLAYLVGQREFWSLDFAVSPGVLIPRPETETLVEAALAVLGEAHPQPPVIVDLCTGTGAIAIALAREIPGATVIATDISRRAIRIARGNAETHGVADRVTFLRGDLWRALNGHVAADGAGLVVSNPPYVPSGALSTLMPEVQWEPRRALDGGADGLRFHREIIAGAPRVLRAGGVLLLEIGGDQGGAVSSLLEAGGGFEAPRILRDLAGRDRVVAAQRRTNSKMKN
ncbi:MAG: peptide chain release factor N(5)-glutamine methyltransferase [candidate division NC10 bacterium]|nr:peptide chain release factor N(5)-glutamine methyltransferase [candidate division NC10 bacterium]